MRRPSVARTCEDCSSRSGSASGAGGFTRATCSIGLRAERQLESRKRQGAQACEGGRMAIRRRCRGTCRSARRCVEHLWFDVKHRGTRYRMPVNDFAVPRMEPNKQRPVQSMEEVRDWERLFVGEIKAGRDPRLEPARKEKAPDIMHVSGFLDAYFETHLKPAGIRSLDTAAGRLKVLKRYLGDLLVKALEEPAVINRFKAESEYARRVEIATLHKVLALLRASIRWGQAQTPPIIDKS